MWACVCICVCVNLFVWSTHMSLTQSVRSSSSVSHGAPCPSGVCGDRNRVSQESKNVHVQKLQLLQDVASWQLGTHQPSQYRSVKLTCESGINRIWIAPKWTEEKWFNISNQQVKEMWTEDCCWFISYLTPYAKMMSPIRTPMVPSRNQTSAWCLKTSALIRMENPMIAPTIELNPATHKMWKILCLFFQK